MKIMLSILVVLFAVPVFAQTYTDTEFVVQGQPTAPGPAVPQPGTTTVTTTATGSCVAPVPGTTTTVVTTTIGESPIHVGMSKAYLLEVMGRPTYVDKFKRFSARQQGIYDEVWTYQTPTGVTYVYIKERRVDKIEYR